MASLDDIMNKLIEIENKVNLIAKSSSITQQVWNSVWNERSLITQLKMEGKTHAEALAYVQKMNNGERPWELEENN